MYVGPVTSTLPGQRYRKLTAHFVSILDDDVKTLNKKNELDIKLQQDLCLLKFFSSFKNDTLQALFDESWKHRYLWIDSWETFSSR